MRIGIFLWHALSKIAVYKLYFWHRKKQWQKIMFWKKKNHWCMFEFHAWKRKNFVNLKSELCTNFEAKKKKNESCTRWENTISERWLASLIIILLDIFLINLFFRRKGIKKKRCVATTIFNYLFQCWIYARSTMVSSQL